MRTELPGRRPRHRSYALLAMIWLCLGGARVAAAPPPAASKASEPAPASEVATDPCLTDPECKKLVDSGRSLSEATQFEPALLAYQGAYGRRAVPWLLVNIGRMQQKLGHHSEALSAYEQFLKTPLGQADRGLRSRVLGYLAEAENTVAEQKKQTAAEQARLASQQSRLDILKTQLDSERDTLMVEQGKLAAAKKPVYKRWWFWTLIGGATAAVVTTVVVSTTLAAQAREPDYVAALPQFRPFP